MEKKIEIQIEFIIEGKNGEYDPDEMDRTSAAMMAAFNNLCLTSNGQDVVKSVDLNVDGYGVCNVKLGENG